MFQVSVIIPTYNRLPRLRRVLDALSQQTYSQEEIEVVVVSDGSEDGTWEFLQQAEYRYQLVPLQQANSGPAVARNFGIANSHGKNILFLDDDVVPSIDLVAEHLHSQDEYDENAISLGPMLTPPDAHYTPWVDWEQVMLSRQYDAMSSGQWDASPRQFYTGNTLIGRQLLLQCKGFDPAFRRAEDLELALRLARAGAKFVFTPQAIGYHYAERSFGSWFSIPYDYGTNEAIFATEKGHPWLLETIRHEYLSRNRLTRRLTRVCLDRPAISQICFFFLKQTAQISYTARLRAISCLALSALFNIRYYQGVADQFDGRETFFTAFEALQLPE